MKYILKYIWIIVLVFLISSCKESSINPVKSEIYGIWKGSLSDIEANIDTVYIYTELNSKNDDINGQGYIDVTFIRSDIERTRYFRSGKIYGQYIGTSKSVQFHFDDEEKNTKYSFFGKYDGSQNTINGMIFIEDTKYSKDKDTTFTIPILLYR